MATFNVTNSSTNANALASLTPTTAVTGSVASASGALATPYTPIGFGKPLSVELITIYTGTFQTKGLFAGNKRDILCVSGAKASETFDATPRAINLLQQNVPDSSFLQFQAFQSGTPYVYYKDAVTDDSIDITIELTANSFNDSLFGVVEGLMDKAAGLPIFMPAAGKLLAGAQFVNMLEAGASDLFTTSPFLSQTITIQFDTAGLPANTAQSMLICQDQDQAELQNYQVETVMVNGSARMQLTNSAGVYSGTAPYVIINIDGASKPDLQNWSATAASSSILSEFYGSGVSASSTITDNLQQAMSLYNDYSYYNKATATAQQLKGLGPTDPQYATLESLYQACVSNIQNPAFSSQLAKVES